MATVRDTEKQLAIVTNWALFASFGMGLILSGFGAEQWEVSLGGFSAFVLGFIAHVIINRLYRTGFGKGEIMVGFVAFGVVLLCFIFGWIFDPAFGAPDVAAGIAGFGAIIACFVVYVVTKFGLKGSFSMFHDMRHH